MKPVKMGIEIEYLMMAKNGAPIYSGWKQADISRYLGLQILQDAARQIEPGISRTSDTLGHLNVYKFADGKVMLPDTFTLLETVTSPSTNLDVLRDQLWTMKRALIAAAEKHQHSIVSGAACPIGYRYESMAREGRTTANNAGMHIHLEAPNDKIKIKFCNLLMQVMPELTALSVNSPIYDRHFAQCRSKRLQTSPLVGVEGVSPLEYEPGNPLQFSDSSKRYRYLTPYTKSQQTIELRGFDTPMTIDWAMAIAAVVQCLGVKASRLFVEERRNTVVGNNGKIRRQNFDAAMTHGLRAKFRSDRTFGMKVDDKRQKMSFLYHGEDPLLRSKQVPATIAAKRLLYYIEAEAYELGLVHYLMPLYAAVLSGKDQAEKQLDWFQSMGYQGYFDRLAKEAGSPPTTSWSNMSDGRKYFTVRQIAQKADSRRIVLTRAGMARVNAREGDLLTVSGPLGCVQAVVASEGESGSTIALNDDEIRIGQKLRNQLGISMYDPVIVDHKQWRPIVIELTNAAWSSSGALSALSLNRP